MHSKLSVVATVCLLFSLWQGCSSERSAPNVILVTLDTTRADHLGCYGGDKRNSPNIDSIAGEGVLFEQAIAQAAVTPVSHASIMTGLNPFEHGLRVLHGASSFRLREDLPTLATLLREQGWQTGAFVSAFPVSEYFGLHRGFELFDTGLDGEIEEKLVIDEAGRANWAVSRNQRRADATTERALAWLGETGEPFFLWLHYFDPHDTTLSPPLQFTSDRLTDLAELTQADRLRAIYDVEIAYMDQQLGRLFNYLKQTGRYEDTIIVITNDHGEGLGDHDWWYHRILYQEQLRMPLIIRAPQGPPARRVAELVRSIDIMPTILELVGLEAPPVTGKSLVQLMRGKEESSSRMAYADALIRLDDNRPSHADGSIHDDLIYCAIGQFADRPGSWKLIHRHFQTEASELYRLDQDPFEEQNVIYEYPEIRQRLLEFLEQPGIMIEELIPGSPDNETIERLKALGYIN